MRSIILLAAALLLSAATVSHAQDYIIIGWNDLGMHCSNKEFANLAILPPYNNIYAQVIRVGDSTQLPEVVTDGLRVAYEIPGNTYSVGKTDFWDYDSLLFGVNLPPDIGLTGAGLSGDMIAAGDHFVIEEVPITPYVDSDLVNEDPFQLGLLSLYDSTDQLLATAQPVVPVSNEIGCVSFGCHSAETHILFVHEDTLGFDPNDRPVFCATCHASNALGMVGEPGVPSLSEAIHKKHGGFVTDCYKCHPGENTQCLRSAMEWVHGFTCQTCHGTVTEVGESISDGREPWFDEPSCGDVACHGATYAEEPGLLFRQSRGHGGLFCSTCHGEPHAEVPSRVDRDNVQQIALQGFAGSLGRCETCHGVVPAGAGPHGLTSTYCCVGDRGNIDNDSFDTVDIADLVYLVTHMFQQGPAPACFWEVDVNADGVGPDIADLVYLVSYMFQEGPAPEPCP